VPTSGRTGDRTSISGTSDAASSMAAHAAFRPVTLPPGCARLVLGQTMRQLPARLLFLTKPNDPPDEILLKPGGAIKPVT
jgi:hypothetical protein